MSESEICNECREPVTRHAHRCPLSIAQWVREKVAAGKRVFTGDRFDSARPLAETVRLIRSDIRAAEDAGTLPPIRWRITALHDEHGKPRITIWVLDSSGLDDRNWHEVVDAIVSRYNQTIGFADDRGSIIRGKNVDYVGFDVWGLGRME